MGRRITTRPNAQVTIFLSYQIWQNLRGSEMITFNQALLGKYFGALVETGEEYRFLRYVIGVN